MLDPIKLEGLLIEELKEETISYIDLIESQQLVYKETGYLTVELIYKYR